MSLMTMGVGPGGFGVPAGSALVFDAASSAAVNESSGATYSWTHTAGASAPSKVLIAIWSSGGGRTPSAAPTYDGISTTLLSTNGQLRIYGLTGGGWAANGVTVSVSLTGTGPVKGGAMSFTGGTADAATTWTVATNTGTNVQPTATVASSASEIVANVVAAGSTSGQTTTTHTGTTAWDGFNGTAYQSCGQYETGSASVVSTWSLSAYALTWYSSSLSVK